MVVEGLTARRVGALDPPKRKPLLRAGDDEPRRVHGLLPDNRGQPSGERRLRAHLLRAEPAVQRVEARLRADLPLVRLCVQEVREVGPPRRAQQQTPKCY